MEKRKIRRQAKINSGSMADIAFLLLIFFLVTTTIQTNQGLSLKLPPEDEKDSFQKKIHERNLFKVLVNSKNELLVEGDKFISYNKLKEDAKAFILNNGKLPHLSDNPEEAIISLKVDRGTKYNVFIQVLDALQGAYYEIYGDRIGISADDYRKLNLSVPKEKQKYLSARAGIPMNISIAEPTKTNYYGTF